MRSGSPRLRFPAWLLVSGVALAVGASELTAGEPIRFSGRTGPPLAREAMERAPFLPAEARTDRSLARPELPVDAFLVPSQAVTPTTGVTRRQLEAQDRRRNWIAQSPDALQQEANNPDEDKDRDPRGERGERDPSKSATARNPDGQDHPNDPSAKTRNPAPARKSERDRNPASGRAGDAREDGDGKARSGWETRSPGTSRSGPDGFGLFDAGQAREGVVGRALSEARDRERQRDRDASLDTFKRTFANPWAQTASGGANPSLLPGGSPAPAFGVPGGDFRRPSSSGGLGTGARMSVDLGPRGGAGDFDPKNPLNYGAPSTVLRNNEPPRPASKPIVLEVPKRKF